MKVFVLLRTEDVTGISGTGVVAEGIEFSDGRAALRWVVGDNRSTVSWDSIEQLKKIHGHEGKTQLLFLKDLQ